MNHPQAQPFDTMALKPKKIGSGGQRQPDNHEKNGIRNKIREGHKSNAAEQRNEALLLLSVDKVGKTDRTENHSPKQERFATH
jgi:hypothetical protein